jgi:hypothetical protein
VENQVHQDENIRQISGCLRPGSKRYREKLSCKMAALRPRIVPVWLAIERSDTLRYWSGSMSRFNPLLWPKPPAIWGYGIALLLVTAAVIISRLPALHMQTAPSSLFLFAILLSAWFGGVGPGMLATTLCALAFYYYYLPPEYSMIAKPGEIPRLAIFVVVALSVGALSAAQRSATESLRRARDYLTETVKELQRTNEALQAESRERKSAEGSLRRSEGYLAEAQRLSHTGSWARDAATDEMKYSSEEFYRVLGFDPHDGQPR